MKEVLEAYTEAVTHHRDTADFWRSVALERMELLNDAVRDYERTRGINPTKPQGS